MLFPKQGVVDDENRALKREMVFLTLILSKLISYLKCNSSETKYCISGAAETTSAQVSV